MAEKTKYIANTSFALADGTHARRGEIVALSDADARRLNKSKAIGLYLADGDEAPDDLPKPKERKKRRTGKPTGPATLDMADTIAVDPRAQ